MHAREQVGGTVRYLGVGICLNRGLGCPTLSSWRELQVSLDTWTANHHSV